MVVAVTVIAPVAVVAGVVAARLAGAGHTFAVTLGVTIACGLVSGALAVPGRGRRAEARPADRPPAGDGRSGF